MQSYLIEPLAPLVFRSGKPFGSTTGADGGNFPLPSSSAGLLRTVSADQADAKFSDDLKKQACSGPFLVRHDSAGRLTVLVPKPGDALYLKDKAGDIQVVRLAPQAFEYEKLNCGSDLPAGLLPVQMQLDLKGKPDKGPQFWALDDLLTWQSGAQLTLAKLKKNGLDSLPTERRTHVALDDNTLASADGQLFQTSGLVLNAADATDAEAETKQKWSAQQLGFLLQGTASLEDILVTFGGERRLSRLRHLAQAPAALTVPDGLSAALQQHQGIKLTLLTPAIFAKGYLPNWLDETTMQGDCPLCPGLRLRLRAVAIDRWQPVSGWDLVQKKPKAMRKAVPAGSVYWFEVVGEVPDGAAKALWLQPLSDHEQDRLDGFGAALVAAWPAR